MRYFWWAEFQKRTALHYHLVVVDAPFELLRDARHWFDAHWTDTDGRPLAGIQTWVDWKPGRWFRDHAADYVLKDVGKGHRKGYEQDYTHMPRGWRTFRCHQLTYPAAVHQEHETKAHSVCVADHVHTRKSCFRTIYVYRVDHHVPAIGGCHLPRALARARNAPRRTKAETPSPETGRSVPGGQQTPAISLSAAPFSPTPSNPSPAGCAPGSEDLARDTAGRSRARGPYNRLCRTQVRRSLSVTAAAFRTGLVISRRKVE